MIRSVIRPVTIKVSTHRAKSPTARVVFDSLCIPLGMGFGDTDRPKEIENGRVSRARGARKFSPGGGEFDRPVTLLERQIGSDHPSDDSDHRDMGNLHETGEIAYSARAVRQRNVLDRFAVVLKGLGSMIGARFGKRVSFHITLNSFVLSGCHWGWMIV